MQPRRRAARGAAAGWAWIRLAGFILGCSCLLGAAAEKPVVQEYQLKAALVMKLPLFIEWPSSPPTPTPKELIIGVLGTNPFGNHLETISRNKPIAGRAAVIRMCQNLEEARACHLVFIADSEKARLQEILTALRSLPVLTVSDSPAFAQNGGMVGLVASNHKVGLEINQPALRAAGLKVDPQLLQLARIIGSGTEPPAAQK